MNGGLSIVGQHFQRHVTILIRERLNPRVLSFGCVHRLLRLFYASVALHTVALV